MLVRSSIPTAVLRVTQHFALAIEEAQDLKHLEHEAAVLVEDMLAVFALATELNLPDLST